jgi:Leucine-rich repeat (LRR) protein
MECFLCDWCDISHFLYFCIGLDANDLRGPIPEEIKAFSSTLKELRITNHILRRSNNVDLRALSGVSNFAALTNLEVLDLSGNKFPLKIPDDFGDLKQLQSLYLNDNQFSGSIPSTFEALTNLKRLYLQNNNLEGNVESGTSTLELLEELVVNENKELHLANFRIYELSNLQILGLGGVHFQQFPDRLSKLPNLQELNLASANITGRLSDIPFAELTNSKSLSLEGNSFTGTVPWSDFPTMLTHLSIQINRLTGALLPEDIGRFASLTSLDVSRNEFVGFIPESIGDWTQLEFLSFGKNEIGGSLPTELGYLVALRYLDLEDNMFQGSIPTEFGALTALEDLYLEQNRLQGQLPSELGRLEALKELFVYANRLTGSVPEVYQDLTNLEYFWFQRNDLTGSVDTIFCINPFVQDLRGDCLGDPSEITCTCCTTCYPDDLVL